MCECSDRTVCKWAEKNGVYFTGEGNRKNYYLTEEDIEKFKERPKPGRRWLWLFPSNGDVDESLLDSMTFDILKVDTWDYASDSKEMIWNGKNIFNNEGRANTEKDVVELFCAIFNFLERNGDIVPLDKKISAIKTLLNRMENPEEYIRKFEHERAEHDKNIPDGKFNPRDPKTWEFAKYNKPLVIDGISIFNTYWENGKEVKKDETEKGFVNVLSHLSKMKLQDKAEKWDAAVKQAWEECKRKGIENPNNTPEYVNRIEAIYQSFFENYPERNEEYDQEFIEKHIKQKLAECSPKKLVNYGGYDFSEAQMEVLYGCPVETIEKVGRILTTDKSGSKLKQELFNSLAMDGHWVVELRNVSSFPDIEEGIMYDFYQCYEDFETEQEIRDFFNSRPYLEKRPELRQKVIEQAIYLHIDMEDNE